MIKLTWDIAVSSGDLGRALVSLFSMALVWMVAGAAIKYCVDAKP
jgi:hypothetical protein